MCLNSITGAGSELSYLNLSGSLPAAAKGFNPAGPVGYGKFLLVMPGQSIEPYIVGLAVPAAAVLMGMAWYKFTSRRNRKFEPTLWFAFRWGFILLLVGEIPLANADNLIRFHRSHPVLFVLGTLTALFLVFMPAVLDWRRAVKKERRQLERARKDRRDNL
jgi:membrane-bound metal-dependent hydrolase YbcI (DUF457 family)